MPTTAISPYKSHDKISDAKSTDNSVSAYSQKLAIQKSAIQKLAIQHVAKVCVMHGLPSGSAADLGTFMRALDTDKLLAMNFWSLVVKITDQIGEHIQSSAQETGSNSPLLEAIAHGVTGRSVAAIEAAGGEPKWLIQQMAAMLAGEDIQIPAAMPMPAKPIPSSAPPVQTATPVPTAQPDSDRSRLVLKPEAAVSRPLLGQRALFGSEAQEEKARPVRVPLEGYGATHATGNVKKIASGLLIVAALGGGAFFLHGDGAPLQQTFGASIRAHYDAAWRGAKGMGDWVSTEVFGR